MAADEVRSEDDEDEEGEEAADDDGDRVGRLRVEVTHGVLWRRKD